MEYSRLERQVEDIETGMHSQPVGQSRALMMTLSCRRFLDTCLHFS